jgi:Holliday junction resolvase RusA-like endonuclease
MMTPEKTRRYEADVKLWASKFAPKKPLTGPLKITARFFVPRPKRPKSVRPITRPDLDNYLKGVLDALNEMIWQDDSQIVALDAEKFYVMDDIGPRVTLLVEEL